jgi:hypothetical protein
MKRLLYIERLALAVWLLMLLTLAPAMAQPFVHTGETTTLTVVQNPGDTYEWGLYNDGTVNFATDAGNCPVALANFVGGNTGTSVNVQWYKAGIYFFRVKAMNASGCTENIKIGTIEVKLAVTAEIIPPDTAGICVGDSMKLEVKLTGTPPWNFTYTDGTTEWKVTNVQTSPYTIIDPAPSVTTDYWIKEVSDKYGTNTDPSEKVTQKINPLPDPSSIIHRK